MATRAIRWLGWTLVVSFAILAGFVTWLAISDSALHWMLGQAQSATGGKLSVQGAERTGVLAFDAEVISHAEDTLRIEAERASVVVSLASVLRMRPVVRTLHVETLRIVMLPGDAAPPVPPVSLSLPIPFDIVSLRVPRLVVEAGEAPIELRDVDLGLRYGAARYDLTLRRLVTPWGAVEGSVELADRPPFGLAGSLWADPAIDGLGRMALALDGTLTVVGIGLSVPLYGGALVAGLGARPFAPDLLAEVQARIAGLDPRRVLAAAPDALLDGSVQARVRRDGRIGGNVRIVNTRPGAPASGRVPIESLRANFAGEGGQWRLADIVLDAGRAGRLSGAASIAADRIEARLQAQALDLKALNPRLYATALAGPLRVDWDGRRARFEGRLQQDDASIALDAAYESDRVEVANARFASAAGVIEARGTLAASAPHAFDLTGRVSGLDPARLGDYPAARLNGTFGARGAASPLALAFETRIADSRFRDLPLSGSSSFRFTPGRLQDLALELRLGSASARASGSFGAAGDQLAWRFEVPDATRIEPQAAGSFRASGILLGGWDRPAGTLEADASGVRWGESVRIARATTRVALGQGGDGRIDARVEAQGLRAGAADVERLDFALSGTRAQHEARVDARTAGHRVRALLAGAQAGEAAWRGTLERLDVEGPFPARLEAAASIAASRDDARIGQARLLIGAGRLELGFAEWSRARGWASRGSLAALTLGALQPLLPVPEAVRTLTVGGEWDIAAGETLAGTLALRREAGDIVVLGSPPLPARLAALTMEATARGTAISWRAVVESANFGRASLTGATQATRRDGQWGVAGDAPLAAELQAVMPSLAWTRPLLGDTAGLDGAAQANVRATGTIARPVFSGRVQARDLTVRVPEYGLALGGGTLDANLAGRQLVIESVAFTSGAGRVVGSGSVSLQTEQFAARLALKAERLTVLSRPDRLVIVSGGIELSADERRLRATGRLRADRGVIELPREDTPRPSADVFVIGAKPIARRELDVHADLQLDLGEDFTVRGRGLSTRLGGTLRAQVAPVSGIVLTGTVRAIDGAYTAFGQTLAIQRGALTFAGPAENPALDILAVRKLPTVEVGVAVGGTALLPQVRLVSTPPMSDADKLAWLTLGHGLDQAGRNESAVLQAAALALLSRGNTDGSKGTLASRFGLDVLSLGTQSATGERVVSVGKQLASNFYLGFERGITGAVSVIKITVDLSRRWSVQARAGSENAVDLFYTLGFR